MTKEEFITDLFSTYKSKDEDLNKAFYAQLTSFANKCKEPDLEEVNDYIVKKHDFPSPFKLSLAYKYAEKKGFMIEREKVKRKRDPIWLKCIKCGAKYSKHGKICPKCREPLAIISTGQHLPEGFVDVKEDCAYCTIYPNIEKNTNWNTAINCELYGKKQDAGCNFCQCKECCRQMMMFRADRAGTVAKYRTGELGQPWLTSVKPLNETVEKMVKDMKKGVDVYNILS